MSIIKRNKDKQANHRQSPAPQRAPVFSYYSSRSSEDSRQSERSSSTSSTSVGRLRQVPTAIAVLAIIVSFFYVLMVDIEPRIELFADQQASALLRDRQVYAQAGQRILESSLLNRSKLTINTNQVADKLKSEFPELEDVEITTPIVSRRLVFELKPSSPALILTSRGSAPFIVDKQGRAVVGVAEAQNVNRDELVTVNDSSGLDIEAGSAVLTRENVEFITAVLAQLKAHKQTVSSVTLPPVANELHIRLKGKPYFVKFNLQGDALLQAGTLIAVQQKLQTDNMRPNDYIDVRVEDRAYYR